MVKRPAIIRKNNMSPTFESSAISPMIENYENTDNI